MRTVQIFVCRITNHSPMNVIDRAKTFPLVQPTKCASEFQYTWKGLAFHLSTANHMFAMKYKFVFIFVYVETKRTLDAAVLVVAELIFFISPNIYICICMELYTVSSCRRSFAAQFLFKCFEQKFYAKQTTMRCTSMLMKFVFLSFLFRFISVCSFCFLSSFIFISHNKLKARIRDPHFSTSDFNS